MIRRPSRFVKTKVNGRKAVWSDEIKAAWAVAVQKHRIALGSVDVLSADYHLSENGVHVFDYKTSDEGEYTMMIPDAIIKTG